MRLAAQAVKLGVPPPQTWPTVQGAQEPPQSTPVSLPFLIPSVQELAAQMPPTHEFDLQSRFREQVRPEAQGLHGPPQSVAVSKRPGSKWPLVQVLG